MLSGSCHMGVHCTVIVKFQFSSFPVFQNMMTRQMHQATTPPWRGGGCSGEAVARCALVARSDAHFSRQRTKSSAVVHSFMLPVVSTDGRSAKSKFWGPHGRRSERVRMCPHVKPGGGQCGLDEDHCFCLCLLCSNPMRARKRCLFCPWGRDRSPEVSTPEQESPPPKRPRKVHWHVAAYGQSDKPGPAPSVPPGTPQESLARLPRAVLAAALPDHSIGGGRCLPNLVPGGHDGLPYSTPRRARTKQVKPKATISPITTSSSSSPPRSVVKAAVPPVARPSMRELFPSPTKDQSVMED